MGLKAFVQSIDDIPNDLRELYVKTDEGFVLDVDDKDFKQKISEFRDNNISLRQQVDAAKQMEQELKKLKDMAKNFDGMDPEKAREALNRIQELEEQNLLDAGKVDEVVTQRTERMRQDFEGRIEALSKKLEESSGTAQRFKGLYSDTVIESGLQRAVSEIAKVRPGAMQDILHRGKTVWSVDEDGNPIPRDTKGKVRYGKDGEKPITMQEWAESLVLDAPYLFEGSAGGGSTSGRGDGSGVGRVSASDQNAINSNLEAIAAGKVEVISNQS